ncbi:MAG: response regulator [Chloroflexi bacterium]|nr:MAG: response regulator [Chloroflexota bacterium]
MGLALVRRMAEMHGGSVTLQSEVDHGSRFTISLPWQAEPQTAASTPAENVDSVAGRAIRRALIVEDSPVVADQYQRYFAEFGVEAHVCKRAKNATATAKTMRPDVIILDIMLPDRPGWQILKELKQNTATQQIPVIVASVLDESALGSKLGAAEYLVKPISRQQLQQTLEQVCGVQLSPLSPLPTPNPPLSPNGHTAGSAPDEKARPLILLAEDNELNLNTLSDYLLNSGYRVVSARNGAEAIERAKEETPNLILMDIQMPIMDGFEAMQRLKANARFAKIPIIALTALAMPGDREKCLAAGANEYMSKPISLKGLAQMIQTQLRNVSAEREFNHG